MLSVLYFFFKQKTAYEMRISDWSSDVCSSDLQPDQRPGRARARRHAAPLGDARCVLLAVGDAPSEIKSHRRRHDARQAAVQGKQRHRCAVAFAGCTGAGSMGGCPHQRVRSEEHPSEHQSLIRLSYAVFCLKKKRPKDNSNKILT